LTTILLNTGNPITRDEAQALVDLIAAFEDHLLLTGFVGLSAEERAGLVKLQALAGTPVQYH
jgi:hypothetical protein